VSGANDVTGGGSLPQARGSALLHALPPNPALRATLPQVGGTRKRELRSPRTREKRRADEIAQVCLVLACLKMRGCGLIKKA
jgi:hypothetical protein